MQLSFIYILLISTMISLTHAQSNNTGAALRYTKVTNGYVMVLRQGDNIMAELEKFAFVENIPSAHFTGMGFVNITFGFFDNQSKAFTPKEFKDLELASMHGTIAYKDGKPSIHAHGVAGDKSFQTFGGHMLDATVSTGSVEIFIANHNKRLIRKKDETLGADVLQIE